MSSLTAALCFIFGIIADTLGIWPFIPHAAMSIAINRTFGSGNSPKLLRFINCVYLLLVSYDYIILWRSGRSSEQHETDTNKRTDDTKLNVLHGTSSAEIKNPSEEILGPLLFPSHTTHRRLIPKPHSFGYSYLLVGVPIHDHDTNSNGFLSTQRSHPEIHRAFLSVHSSDYLQRGSSFAGLSLRKKLDVFLESEGVRPSAFPNGYLVTAPRFLGWSFNPVSFWYLYNSEGVLAAMILEVNNTFDERRMYLLQADTNDHGSATKKFAAKWKKDFHVSPFNDRTGTYSVSAVDIAATQTVDVTIVLDDMDQKPKLVARIFSSDGTTSRREGSTVGPGINPRRLSKRAFCFFLLRHGWKGFFTNPRILRQAWTLWRKNLTVFFRPEPFSTSIGRNETKEEIIIERAFRNVLQLLAHESEQNIIYTPAAGQDRGRMVNLLGKHTLRKGEYADEKAKSLSLNILSPQFYVELAITNGSLLHAFERTCFCDDKDQILATTSDKQGLRRLLRRDISRIVEQEPYKTRSAARQTRVVVFLRAIEQVGFAQACKQVLISLISRRATSASFSQLDTITLNAMQDDAFSSQEKQEYMSASTVILCANQFAFGSHILLRIQQSLCRAILLIFLTGVMVVTGSMISEIIASSRAAK